MGLLDSALNRLGYVKAVPPMMLRTATNERYNVPDPAYPDNQLKAYQVLSWIADAVGYVSRYAATVELEVMALQGEDKKAIPNHPLELLFNRPSPIASRFQLFEATYANYLLSGNAYWFLNRSNENARPIEVYVLPSNRVRVVPGGQVGVIGWYEWDAGGEIIKLEPWEVVQFIEYHPRSMFVGLSRVESVAKEVEKDSKAATYDLNFYGADNAKPEGLLSFKGNVPDQIWDELQDRFVRKHGGVKRSIAMLQRTGDIDYKQLALNYADMDFIANREFTRDQIYNHWAPGLASVLSVNATEANSRTGKATLMEFGIWPLLVSIQETITNTILPAYGDNLVCEFEDVRLSDKTMEIAEQTEFARTHTIDEIRQEYYNDDPIGDDRGKMLIVQVGQTTVRTSLNADVQQTEQQQQSPSGVVQTSPAAPEGEDGEIETAGQVKALPDDWQNVYDELTKWKRHTEKKLKAGKRLREFNTEYVPPSLKAAIEGALSDVTSIPEVSAVFADALTWQGYP